jgi:hypothetical protein
MSGKNVGKICSLFSFGFDFAVNEYTRNGLIREVEKTLTLPSSAIK